MIYVVRFKKITHGGRAKAQLSIQGQFGTCNRPWGNDEYCQGVGFFCQKRKEGKKKEEIKIRAQFKAREQ